MLFVQRLKCKDDSVLWLLFCSIKTIKEAGHFKFMLRRCNIQFLILSVIEIVFCRKELFMNQFLICRSQILTSFRCISLPIALLIKLNFVIVWIGDLIWNRKMYRKSSHANLSIYLPVKFCIPLLSCLIIHACCILIIYLNCYSDLRWWWKLYMNMKRSFIIFWLDIAFDC